MNNIHLDQLILLSKIDKTIDDFEPKITKISKPLKDIQNKIENLDQQSASLDKELLDLNKQYQQVLNSISEYSNRINELSKRSAHIRNEREARSQSLDEEIAKEQLNAANEELIRIEKLIKNKEIFKAENLALKNEEENKLKEIEKDINLELESLKKEKINIYNEKEELTKKMKQKVLSFYEKIRKWAKNTTLVPVRKQACYGCFMKIYDKTYMSILKNEDIITCPHCGRILYIEDESIAK